MDIGIKKVVRALQDNGHYDNTILWFISDNAMEDQNLKVMERKTIQIFHLMGKRGQFMKEALKYQCLYTVLCSGQMG